MSDMDIVGMAEEEEDDMLNDRSSVNTQTYSKPGRKGIVSTNCLVSVEIIVLTFQGRWFFAERGCFEIQMLFVMGL